jgi:hypothetical protein
MIDRTPKFPKCFQKNLTICGGKNSNFVIFPNRAQEAPCQNKKGVNSDLAKVELKKLSLFYFNRKI